MFIERSRVFAGGIALSLLLAGGCAPAGWPTRAEAEELDDRLTVSGDIFDRPGSDNPCRGREITIDPGSPGDTGREAAIARALIAQCRPALTYEELLYRYTRTAAERDEARRQLQAIATMPPPVADAPPEPPPAVAQPGIVDPYPAYSSGSAHPAAPVIFEQDLFQPPVQPAPIVPIIVQPTPVYVSPPPPIIVAPRPPHYRPPPSYVAPVPPPAVYRPPHQPRPPSSPPPVVHRPPPVVHQPSPPPTVYRPPPVVHQPSPPPTVYRPPPPAPPPSVIHRPPPPAPVVHSPPPPSPSRPPAGSVGQPGQDRSTYGK